MKASELIAQLQELINKHGDLPVYDRSEQDGFPEEVIEIFYIKHKETNSDVTFERFQI